MQAMRTRRSDRPSVARYYLDSRRVSRADWDTANFSRRLDCFALRAFTRRDGVQIVREYHSIRTK